MRIFGPGENFHNFLQRNKMRGPSPRLDYEDGISTNNLVLTILLWCRELFPKRGGALHGLRINREILILRKPPIEVILLYSDSNRKYLFKHHKRLPTYEKRDDVHHSGKD